MGSRHTKQDNAENSEEQVNIGIVNVANQAINTDDLETVLEIISFIILAFLVFRWAKKYCIKRKKAQDLRLASIVSTGSRPAPSASIIELPTAPPKYDFRALQAPRIPTTPAQSSTVPAENLYPQNMATLGLDQYR